MESDGPLGTSRHQILDLASIVSTEVREPLGSEVSVAFPLNSHQGSRTLISLKHPYKGITIGTELPTDVHLS
jgi:hypothetical protein